MEEIGLKSKAIQIITGLSEVYIPSINFNVFPFIGLTAAPPNLNLKFPKSSLLLKFTLKLFNVKHQIKTKVNTSYGLSVSVPAFNFNGHIVWGATYMILMEIIYLLNLILKK